MNISEKIQNANHKLILLNYKIEPQLNKYKTWIGKSEEEEITDILEIIKQNNYDEIIIDHYGIDYVIEKKIKQYIKKLIIINEVYEYNHYCDEYINYNTDDLELVQKINLNKNTIYKIGKDNIIINKKFLNIKKTIFRDKIEKICIMMGGTDPNNYTLKVMEQIYSLINNNISVYIIIGKSNNNIESIKNFIKNKNNYIIIFDLIYDDLINLYMDIDLCIGCLSITAYERLYMNIPQICLKIIDNQNIQQLTEFNICKIDNFKNLLFNFLIDNYNK
jgi:UDP-2,4-diacetamido-2,4,6-trideoxy-beta-L-altropyranose hydrolase